MPVHAASSPGQPDDGPDEKLGGSSAAHPADDPAVEPAADRADGPAVDPGVSPVIDLDQTRHVGCADPAWCAALEGMLPGAELGCFLAELPVDDLIGHELVVVVRAWERQKAHAAARQFEAMARLVEDRAFEWCDEPEGVETGHAHRSLDPCGDELSLALAWTPGRAKNILATAVELAQELPDTLDAMRVGRIDADKARLIADRTKCLTVGDQRRDVEGQALARADRLTRSQLDRVLRRAVIKADPQGAEDRRTHAADGRRITPPQPATDDAEDGMAWLGLYGPVEDLTALYTAVDAAARHAGDTRDHADRDDRRTLTQLRFDTLTGLGWTAFRLGHLGCCHPGCASAAHHGAPGADPAAAEGNDTDQGSGAGVEPGSDIAVTAAAGDADAGGVRPLGRRHGRAATVQVTVAASTLFGADEDPGWLDGFGPITAQAARRIAADATWRRLLTDPATGELLEYGRTTYTPPRRLAEHIVARDSSCRFPTCTHPARSADIDHQHPYASGGSTGAANCWALHRQHHLGKTHHRHTVRTDKDDITWWSTPTGYRYAVPPEAIGPITARGRNDEVGPHRPPESPRPQPPPF